jgi:hypothetical protein
VGAPDADRVIVMMGSGAEAADEAVEYLNTRGEKVGLVKVCLYRPFSVKSFCEALPPSVRRVAVLDRTKEAGAAGEPLYLDVVNALQEGARHGFGKVRFEPLVIGGRYGLSSKEFTPAMLKAVYDNLNCGMPKEHFTLGIQDDVGHTSLDYDPEFSTEADSVVRAMFYGLGADGTMGAHKNPIKIIGENTDNYAQGYFVYDSKKSGAMTVSHLRLGPKPIRCTYLVCKANFVACHQWIFLERYAMARRLDKAGANALVLFNRFYQPDIDLEELEIKPNVLLSTPHALRLPLTWIGILYGRVRAHLAASSGIHDAQDVLRLLMVGANVTMLCSTLLRNGINHIRSLEQGMLQWMEQHEYDRLSRCAAACANCVARTRQFRACTVHERGQRHPACTRYGTRHLESDVGGLRPITIAHAERSERPAFLRERR